jgi:hypothetical protein
MSGTITEDTLEISSHPIIAAKMTENTKTLLRLLAYQGEVDVDAIADRTTLTIDELREAAVEGLFEVWALEWGEGEPALLKLTVEGYYVARQLLHSEGAEPPASDAMDEPRYRVEMCSTLNAENRKTWTATLYENDRVAMSTEVPRDDDDALRVAIDSMHTARSIVHHDDQSPPMAAYQVDRRLGVLIPALERLLQQ